MSTAVCITTRNEDKSIYPLVRFFTRQKYHVVVVDDGSTDTTVFAAEMAGATVVQLGGGCGIGPSLMRGWTVALREGATSILQIDAGGSHQPEDAAELEAAYFQQDADLVIGSRFRKGSNYLGQKTLRPVLSRIATTMCNYAQSGAHYTDWTSGYRMFSSDAIKYLLKQQYVAKMHGWQIEVLAHAGARGLKIVEVPITYIPGVSSFNRSVANESFQSWLHVLNHVGWVGSKLDVH